MNALRSSVSTSARRISGLSKGGLSRLISRLVLTLVGTTRRPRCGAWLSMSFISGTVISVGKVMSNLPATKPSIAVERFGMIVYSMPSR